MSARIGPGWPAANPVAGGRVSSGSDGVRATVKSALRAPLNTVGVLPRANGRVTVMRFERDGVRGRA